MLLLTAITSILYEEKLEINASVTTSKRIQRCGILGSVHEYLLDSFSTILLFLPFQELMMDSDTALHKQRH